MCGNGLLHQGVLQETAQVFSSYFLNCSFYGEISSGYIFLFFFYFLKIVK